MSTRSNLFAALALGPSIAAIAMSASAQTAPATSTNACPSSGAGTATTCQPAGNNSAQTQSTDSSKTATGIATAPDNNLITGKPPLVNTSGEPPASNAVTTAGHLATDTPTDLNGIRTACAGDTPGDRADPKWKTFGAKIETVGGSGQVMGDVKVRVTKRNGSQVTEFTCAAPWALMKLEPGRYSVTIAIQNLPEKHVALDVPKHGQRDVIVRYSRQLAGTPPQ